METFISIVIDVIVLVLLVLFSVIGYKKGFLKYFFGGLGTIFVIVAAYFSTGIIAPVVYDHYLQPRVVDHIDEKIKDTSVEDIVSEKLRESGYNLNLSESQINSLLRSDGDISAELSNAVHSAGNGNISTASIEQNMNSFFENEFVGKLGKLFSDFDVTKLTSALGYNKNMAYDTARAMAGGNTKLGAQYLEKNLVRPYAMAVVKIVVFILLCIILTIVVRLIIKATSIMDHVPVANGINKVLGLLLGAAKALVFLAIFAYVSEIIIDATGDSLNKLNTAIIDKTYLFKYVYGFINR